jgi:hypothetical protein
MAKKRRATKTKKTKKAPSASVNKDDGAIPASGHGEPSIEEPQSLAEDAVKEPLGITEPVDDGPDNGIIHGGRDEDDAVDMDLSLVAVIQGIKPHRRRHYQKFDDESEKRFQNAGSPSNHVTISGPGSSAPAQKTRESSNKPTALSIAKERRTKRSATIKASNADNTRKNATGKDATTKTQADARTDKNRRITRSATINADNADTADTADDAGKKGKHKEAKPTTKDDVRVDKNFRYGLRPRHD